MEVIIRKAKPEDIEQLHRLDLECFPDPWSYEARNHDLCEVQWSIYHVAEIQEGENAGAIAGYTAVWHLLDQVDINDVAVSPDFRRNHIASKLMKAMIEETKENGAKAWTLEVRAGNTAAIKLYESFGFAAEAVRKGYYQDNREDAVLMWKRLAE